MRRLVGRPVRPARRRPGRPGKAGALAGLALAASLQTGVATSGFYVKNAKSPSLTDLTKFIKTL